MWSRQNNQLSCLASALEFLVSGRLPSRASVDLDWGNIPARQPTALRLHVKATADQIGNLGRLRFREVGPYVLSVCSTLLHCRRCHFRQPKTRPIRPFCQPDRKLQTFRDKRRKASLYSLLFAYTIRSIDRFASTLVIAASIIAAIRLARVPDLTRPTPHLHATIAYNFTLARAILNRIVR